MLLKHQRSRHRRKTIRKHPVVNSMHTRRRSARANKHPHSTNPTNQKPPFTTTSSSGAPSKYVAHEKNVYSWQNLEQALGKVVATLTTGQAFGELALIKTDSLRTASVIAGPNGCDLIQIGRDAYQKVLAQHEIEFRPQQLHARAEEITEKLQHLEATVEHHSLMQRYLQFCLTNVLLLR